MSGKGDKRRPTNEALYQKEYERIFAKPKEPSPCLWNIYAHHKDLRAND